MKVLRLVALLLLPLSARAADSAKAPAKEALYDGKPLAYWLRELASTNGWNNIKTHTVFAERVPASEIPRILSFTWPEQKDGPLWLKPGFLRSLALRPMHQSHPKETAVVLLECLRSSNSQVVTNALGFLYMLEPEKALAELEKLAKSPDPAVRACATKSLTLQKGRPR